MWPLGLDPTCVALITGLLLGTNRSMIFKLYVWSDKRLEFFENNLVTNLWQTMPENLFWNLFKLYVLSDKKVGLNWNLVDLPLYCVNKKIHPLGFSVRYSKHYWLLQHLKVVLGRIHMHNYTQSFLFLALNFFDLAIINSQ